MELVNLLQGLTAALSLNMVGLIVCLFAGLLLWAGLACLKGGR